MTTAPFKSKVVPATTAYYLLHVIIRLAAYTLLFAHRPALGFVVIILMIGTNFAVLFCVRILKWGCAKEFEPWTKANTGSHLKFIAAGMSFMAPAMSKDVEGNIGHNISFRPWSYNVFYFWNTVIFAVISTYATIFINLLSGFGAISLHKLDLPLLTLRQANQTIGNQTFQVNETFQVRDSPINSKRCVMRMFVRLHQTNDHAKNTRRAR
jgi:hypothetical protein